MQPYEAKTRLRDRYEVVEVLERAPLFILYRVHDAKFSCDWYLYEMDVTRLPEPQRAGACEQFEAQAARFAALRHPGMAQLADHWVEPAAGRAAFLTQATPGASLRRELERHAQGLELDRVVELGTKMLDVLYFFHPGYTPVVFKALSLDNVWITDDDEVQLTGYSLPTWFDPERYAAPGGVYVEADPQFAPPEMRRGDMPTLSSDIWAAGAVLHALALGAPPPGGALDSAAAARIPKALGAVIARCLEPEPASRYHDVGTIKHDLMAVAETFAPETSPSTGGIATVTAAAAPAKAAGSRAGCGAAVLVLSLMSGGMLALGLKVAAWVGLAVR